jgi:tRNA(Arg) A34 adenosine deaminase TadA
MQTPEDFMQEAIRLSLENVGSGKGGPFAALVVKEGKIIATGTNLVTSSLDPTAHAEVTAIRNACKVLNSFQLTGCDFYTTCEPCPMCLGAIYWARPDRVFYGNTREDAAAIGFDDDFIYREIPLNPAERTYPLQPLLRTEALKAFKAWEDKEDKIEY